LLASKRVFLSIRHPVRSIDFCLGESGDDEG
jgi:hypothetical protein